jgi:hypothetical protein
MSSIPERSVDTVIVDVVRGCIFEFCSIKYSNINAKVPFALRNLLANGTLFSDDIVDVVAIVNE